MRTRGLSMFATSVASCALMTAGCSSIASEVAEQTTPAVVGAGLESATTPPNKERLQTFLSETPIKASVVELSPAAIDAVIERLADPSNEPEVRRIIHVATTAIGRELAQTSPKDIQEKKDAVAVQSAKLAARAVLDEVRATLPGLVKEVAANPEVREAFAPLSRSAASGAVKGAADTILGTEAEGE